MIADRAASGYDYIIYICCVGKVCSVQVPGRSLSVARCSGFLSISSFFLLLYLPAQARFQGLAPAVVKVSSYESANLGCESLEYSLL